MREKRFYHGKLKYIFILLLLCVFALAITGCTDVRINENNPKWLDMEKETEDKVFAFRYLSNLKSGEYIEYNSEDENNQKGFNFGDGIKAFIEFEASLLGGNVTIFDTFSPSFNPAGIAENMGTSTYNTINTFASGVSDGMMAVAIGIFLFIWGINMAMKAMNTDRSTEEVVRYFIYLAIGVLVIKNANTIVLKMVELGNAITIKAPSTAQTVTGEFLKWVETSTDVYDFVVIKLMDEYQVFRMPYLFTQGIPRIILVTIPVLPALICSVMVISQMITRMIELFMRTYFAPVPIAMSMNDGWNESTARYFRSTLACVFQIVLIKFGVVLMGMIGNMVLGSIVGSEISSLGIDAAAHPYAQFPKLAFASVIMAFTYIVMIGYLKQTRRLADMVFNV